MPNIGPKFPSAPLFVFEMANNHNGSVEHGKSIIRAMQQISEGFSRFSFAVKLQYRDRDTLLRPEVQARHDVHYIKRFTDTALDWGEYEQLRAEIHAAGMLAICTPFDEVSVGKIVEHGFDYIKVPSCYATDTALLEAVVQTGLSAIISLGGVEEMCFPLLENVARRIAASGAECAVLHCVSSYPAYPEDLNLSQITYLQHRFNNLLRVGYSGHEEPGRLLPVALAAALGATIFERHVGIPTSTHRLNRYSSTPDQVLEWLRTAECAFEMLAPEYSKQRVVSYKETAALRDLQSLHRFLSNLLPTTPTKDPQ